MLALSNSLSLPVTASWLTGDPVVARTPDPPHEVFSLAIGPAVALFLFLAAADHLLVAAPGVYRSYERLIDDNRNYMRWIEYSVSAAVMMVLIAGSRGSPTSPRSMGTFALTTSMILFGLLMERQQRPGCRRLERLLVRVARWCRALGCRPHLPRQRGVASGVRLRHRRGAVRILLQLRREHGAAVPPCGTVARLPLRVSRLHLPQPWGQFGTRLAGVRQRAPDIARTRRRAIWADATRCTGSEQRP